MSVTVSNDPWSGDASRYSDSQWEHACILDRGPSFNTAKTRYGLPVREPNGTLNRHGMSAAAGALSGARTPIKASPEAKSAALSKLKGLYSSAGLTLKADIEVPIWKDDSEDRRVVYGVVLQPGVRDSQGDVVSAGEIEKAAHRYLVESRKSDVQHSEQQAAVDVVESFVAPENMVVGGQPVLKGAWVMASYIGDDDLWDRVKKQEITGYSIGGTGVRVGD